MLRVRARDASDETTCRAGLDGAGCDRDVDTEGEGEGGAVAASRPTMPGIAIPPRPNTGCTGPWSVRPSYAVLASSCASWRRSRGPDALPPMNAANDMGADFSPPDGALIAGLGCETVDADDFSDADAPRSVSPARGEPSWSLAAMQAVQTGTFPSVVGQITYTNRYHACPRRNRHSGPFGFVAFWRAWLA